MSITEVLTDIKNLIASPQTVDERKTYREFILSIIKEQNDETHQLIFETLMEILDETVVEDVQNISKRLVVEVLAILSHNSSKWPLHNPYQNYIKCNLERIIRSFLKYGKMQLFVFEIHADILKHELDSWSKMHVISRADLDYCLKLIEELARKREVEFEELSNKLEIKLLKANIKILDDVRKQNDDIFEMEKAAGFIETFSPAAEDEEYRKMIFKDAMEEVNVMRKYQNE